MKIILFSLGIFFSALGLTFIILYLNLLTIGYSFLEYVYFIIRKLECLIILVGILFIYITLRKRNRL